MKFSKVIAFTFACLTVAAGASFAHQSVSAREARGPASAERTMLWNCFAPMMEGEYRVYQKQDESLVVNYSGVIDYETRALTFRGPNGSAFSFKIREESRLFVIPNGEVGARLPSSIKDDSGNVLQNLTCTRVH